MADGAVAGVDFGTCWSSVVVRRSDGSLVRVKEPVSGSASVPSSVVLAVDGGLSWGTAAENVKRSRPYQSQFKRRWGEPEPLLLGELGVTAVELVAGFVGWLRGLAEAAVGEPLASVVATVPAAYEGHRRELMVHAMAQAGFAERAVRLEVEPVAAARFALADRPARPGERLVVYDLGGGTFDVAVVEVLDDGGLVVLGHGGLPDVGGATFDRMVRDHVLARGDVGELAEALARSRRAWESDDPKEQARLLRPALELDDFCRRVKHQLSGAEVAEDWVPSCDVLFEMSRGEFESLIGPALAETLECCDGVVSDAGLGWGDIDRVVTVGGSSRVPAVAARLAERFGRPAQTVSDPELAVAEGAALPAASPKAGRDSVPGSFLANLPRGFTLVREFVDDAEWSAVAVGFRDATPVVAAAGWDGQVRVWDVRSGGILHTLAGHPEGVFGLAYASSGGRDLLLSAGNRGTVTTWDLETGRCAGVLEDAGGRTWDVAASPARGGLLVATAHNDGGVRLWDAVSGATPRVLVGHEKPVRVVEIVAGTPEPLVVSGDEGGFARVWDGSTGACLRSFQAHVRMVVALASCSWNETVVVASQGEDGSVRLWDPMSLPTAPTHRGGGPGLVTSAGRSGGGVGVVNVGGELLLAAAGNEVLAGLRGLSDAGRGTERANGRIRVWDAHTGRELHQLTGHTGSIDGLALVALDGCALAASAGEDGTVRVWAGQPSVVGEGVARG